MMSTMLVFGEISTSTPSMVTAPRASIVSDEGSVRFCERRISMTSSIAVPTLISARLTDAYCAKSALSWSSSRL